MTLKTVSLLDVRLVDHYLTSKKTIPIAATDVSPHSDQHSEPGFPAGAGEDQGKLSDRDTPKGKELNQELSEESNYREIMRGVRSFMGWHQVLDFDTSSSSLDDNPFAGSRTLPTGKVSVKLPADEWLCKKL